MCNKTVTLITLKFLWQKEKERKRHRNSALLPKKLCPEKRAANLKQYNIQKNTIKNEIKKISTNFISKSFLGYK